MWWQSKDGFTLPKQLTWLSTALQWYPNTLVVTVYLRWTWREALNQSTEIGNFGQVTQVVDSDQDRDRRFWPGDIDRRFWPRHSDGKSPPRIVGKSSALLILTMPNIIREIHGGLQRHISNQPPASIHMYRYHLDAQASLLGDQFSGENDYYSAASLLRYCGNSRGDSDDSIRERRRRILSS
jgi:hypothetical protein